MRIMFKGVRIRGLGHWRTGPSEERALKYVTRIILYFRFTLYICKHKKRSEKVHSQIFTVGWPCIAENTVKQNTVRQISIFKTQVEKKNLHIYCNAYTVVKCLRLGFSNHVTHPLMWVIKNCRRKNQSGFASRGFAKQTLWELINLSSWGYVHSRLTSIHKA